MMRAIASAASLRVETSAETRPSCRNEPGAIVHDREVHNGDDGNTIFAGCFGAASSIGRATDS